jgi:hypothetical protein
MEEYTEIDKTPEVAEQMAAMFAARRAEVIYQVASAQNKQMVRRIEHTVAMRRAAQHSEVDSQNQDLPFLD